MKETNFNKKAIRDVDRRLNEGIYSYPLFCYVPRNYWDDLLICETVGLITTNDTNFNYSRCFTYSFFEDIKSQRDFYSRESRKEVIDRGYLELFYVKISTFGPYYFVQRAKYIPDGERLKLIHLPKCENKDLEAKILEVKAKLDQAEQQEINWKELHIPLKSDIPLEDYEPEDVTYLSYLFD